MNRFTLNALPSDIFNKLLSELRSQGTVQGPTPTLDANTSQYRLETQGVIADVKYSAGAQIAVITILDKPWYASNGMIEQKVRDAVAIARG